MVNVEKKRLLWKSAFAIFYRQLNRFLFTNLFLLNIDNIYHVLDIFWYFSDYYNMFFIVTYLAQIIDSD